jgi:oxygen-independent coproporphyrinogen-3 oxidase
LAGLYVHIPFRRAARTYDDAFTAPTDRDSFSPYAAALERELIYYAQQHASDEPIRTVYAGGGRPSLFSMADVRTVLQTVLNVFDASAIEEATAEVNPADADPTYLSALQSAGFDRLHFEVLSFFPGDLKDLDAPHTAQDAVRAIREARQAGFDNLSIDLLFGWPGQSMKHWRSNLEQAAEMNLPHITIAEWTGNRSSFPAKAHPEAARGSGPEMSGTAAADSSTQVSTEETEHDAQVRAARQLQIAMTYLDQQGYDQYELTHFARPGCASKHQENYYAHGNYLGVGASAHTFWWPRRSEGVPARRWANVRDVDRYQQLLSQQYPPISFRQTIDWKTLADEYIALRLRTGDGLDLRRLKAAYGVDLREEKADLLEKLLEKELVTETNSHQISLTHRGRLVTDGITERLTR